MVANLIDQIIFNTCGDVIIIIETASGFIKIDLGNFTRVTTKTTHIFDIVTKQKKKKKKKEKKRKIKNKTH